MDLFDQIARQAYQDLAIPEYIREETQVGFKIRAPQGVAEHMVPAYQPRCWFSKGLSLCGYPDKTSAPHIGAVTCQECKEQLLTHWCAAMGGQDLTLNRKSGNPRHLYTPSEPIQELGMCHESPMRSSDADAMRDYLSSVYKALGVVLGVTR